MLNFLMQAIAITFSVQGVLTLSACLWYMKVNQPRLELIPGIHVRNTIFIFMMVLAIKGLYLVHLTT